MIEFKCTCGNSQSTDCVYHVAIEMESYIREANRKAE